MRDQRGFLEKGTPRMSRGWSGQKGNRAFLRGGGVVGGSR